MNDQTTNAQDASSSRRSFLQRTAIITAAGASAVMLAGAVGQARAGDQHDHDHDRGREDYRDSEKQFRSIRQHENDHVAYLVNALGSAARPKPTFQGLAQKRFDDFVKLSQTLENTGVGAYLGAAPVIFKRAYIGAAGSIMTIEARHASFLNNLRNDPLTGNAMDDDSNPSFEDSLTAAEVVAGAGGFIKSLNGGPAVGYSTTPSASNDIAILNFALALEYLEAEFYNLNVPKFFGK